MRDRRALPRVGGPGSRRRHGRALRPAGAAGRSGAAAAAALRGSRDRARGVAAPCRRPAALGRRRRPRPPVSVPAGPAGPAVDVPAHGLLLPRAAPRRPRPRRAAHPQPAHAPALPAAAPRRAGGRPPLDRRGEPARDELPLHRAADQGCVRARGRARPARRPGPLPTRGRASERRPCAERRRAHPDQGPRPGDRGRRAGRAPPEVLLVAPRPTRTRSGACARSPASWGSSWTSAPRSPTPTCARPTSARSRRSTSPATSRSGSPRWRPRPAGAP